MAKQLFPQRDELRRFVHDDGSGHPDGESAPTQLAAKPATDQRESWKLLFIGFLFKSLEVRAFHCPFSRDNEGSFVGMSRP